MVKTKGGRMMNPTDAYRKTQRKREVERNKLERKLTRDAHKQKPEELKSLLEEVIERERTSGLGKKERLQKKVYADAYQAALKRKKEEENRVNQQILIQNQQPLQITDGETQMPESSPPQIDSSQQQLQLQQNSSQINNQVKPQQIDNYQMLPPPPVPPPPLLQGRGADQGFLPPPPGPPPEDPHQFLLPPAMPPPPPMMMQGKGVPPPPLMQPPQIQKFNKKESSTVTTISAQATVSKKQSVQNSQMLTSMIPAQVAIKRKGMVQQLNSKKSNSENQEQQSDQKRQKKSELEEGSGQGQGQDQDQKYLDFLSSVSELGAFDG